ncbi:hypothetical protein [Aurantibacter aestuarii]|uniref:Uncharacterized protein n=1 Tax=Aurantibacter aestuarii TaxID=1266046 RepID=A0A2T1NDW0_9FLAO|nr:hypothetical protein [Aurantibacter aestuarii]PSG90579.1 hypothetical protein C7H52_04665 [Aurantibacter aestuarii]
MNSQKIITLVAAIVGVISIVFLGSIIGAGDEAVKAGEASTSVNTFMYIAYAVLAITLVLVVLFTLKNVFTNTSGLKNTLIGVGAFIVVLVIAYAVSGGDTMTYKYNGLVATSGESTMVGAGLVAFYILIVVAAVAMMLGGARKMFK